MADFVRGIKAGLVTATVYLIISAILGFTYSLYSFSDFATAAGFIPVIPDASTLYRLGDLMESWASSFGVRGIVFGAVFAALYNFLPGSGGVKKGVVLSVFLCMVAVLSAVYTTPGWPAGGIVWDGLYYSGTLDLSSPGLGLVGIVSALVFGALTGLLWDRFRGKELTEERKGRPVLLVSFIPGLAISIPFAVMFFGALVTGGVSDVTPRSWAELVFPLIALLGLPGSILTLVAWKRTKVDKSGFKWGLVGGVMMALTGLMLLPGVLAIIGGVLSGHKPASEPSAAAIVQ